VRIVGWQALWQSISRRKELGHRGDSAVDEGSELSLAGHAIHLSVVLVLWVKPLTRLRAVLN
jgi:hypothetical protein